MTTSYMDEYLADQDLKLKAEASLKMEWENMTLSLVGCLEFEDEREFSTPDLVTAAAGEDEALRDMAFKILRGPRSKTASKYTHPLTYHLNRIGAPVPWPNKKYPDRVMRPSFWKFDPDADKKAAIAAKAGNAFPYVVQKAKAGEEWAFKALEGMGFTRIPVA